MTCDLFTGHMAFLFTWLGILLLSSVSLGKTGSLRCPPLVQVELGTDGIIACDIGFKFGNLYWYSGDTFSETPPIVRLENGVPEGGDGFNITPNGSLVVLSADVSLEGTYTIVVFHLNNTYEHSSTALKTFANPKPYFPLFQRCNGVQNCSITADDKGSVQCSIYGARPASGLALQSDGVILFNVTNKNVTDKSSGLTDTTIKAYYKSAECIQLSNITCIATGWEMQEIKSTLTFNDKCSSIHPTEQTGKSSAGAAVIITLVIVVIIAIAVVVTIYFIRKRRSGRSDYEKVNQSDVKPVIPPENKHLNVPHPSKTENSDKKRNVKGNKEILLNALSKKYLSDYFGTPGQGNDRIISIDDVYIDTEFEVKDDNSETSTLSIDGILEKTFINDGKMRLFVSNKMQLTFASHLAYLWSQQEEKDNILLVFNMQDVSYHTTIAKALKEMLQDTVSLNEDGLIKVIEKVGCHIILEGVELKKIVSKREGDDSHEVVVKSEGKASLNTASKAERCPSSKLTINDVLKDHRRQNLHGKISHWVVTFDSDCITANSTPYNVVKMKDVPLFIDRINDYIPNVIGYYFRNSSEEDIKQMNEVVQEVLLNCDIKRKFGKALILLLQIIHLIIKQYITKENTCYYVDTTSLIMKSLALLKVRYGRKFPTKDKANLTTFEEQLGEVAFNQMTGTGDSSKTISEDVIDFSKSIDLIKANEIMFNVAEVECFLVASFLKNEKTLSDFIDDTELCERDAAGDKRFHVLPFICALQPLFSRKICELLLKQGKMSYFLNCFCETTNASEFHETIKKHFEKEDNPIIIYGDKPHLAKIRCLLKYCKQWKIKVNQLIFERRSQKKAPITVVETENFEMPAVRKITFNRIQLDDEERTFVYYIQWIVKHNVEKVSFDNCRLPEFLPDITISLKTILSQSKSTVVIQKMEIQGNMEITYVLNKEKLKWDKKGVKAYKKKEKDTRVGHQDKKQDKEGISSENTVKQQQENKITKQAPDKPPRAGATNNKLVSGQSDLEASTTDDIQSEVNTSNDVQPFKDKKLEGESKDVSVSAAIVDGNEEISKEGSDTIDESKVDRYRYGQPSKINTLEPKDNGQVSGETEDVPSTGPSEGDNLIKDGCKDTTKSEGSAGDPSAT